MPAEVMTRVTYYVRCLDCRYRSRETFDRDEAIRWAKEHYGSFQGKPLCKAMGR